VIVADASVLVAAITDDTEIGAAAFEALQADDQWAGPEHLVVETVAAMRGRWRKGAVSDDRDAAALRFLRRAEITRVDTAPLLSRIWELRDDLTSYDAAYVAAAEALDVPLVTADRRLARAPGLRCRIVVP